METIYIDSSGYARRKTFNLVKDQGDAMEHMYEHCTEGFHNPTCISDTKMNRATLTFIFKCHNLEVYFTGEPK